MLKICIPDSKEKIQEQIKALEYILTIDDREEDIKNHKAALKSLKAALKEGEK